MDTFVRIWVTDAEKVEWSSRTVGAVFIIHTAQTYIVLSVTVRKAIHIAVSINLAIHTAELF